jgi:microcystin-dependent protein
MPSTFSPALRLELIGNGEQAANWGNTTNTNLGTLLEQAITGVSSVAFPSDANYTLVSGNGISDQARNAVLVMTGTLSATRDLIVPTSNKFYAVRNATTGGQSIRVKTAAGTGVTLANGFTQLMYCDGTNVVLASSPVNAITGSVILSNPTINGFTGDTAVINVGSGQFYKDISGNVGIGTAAPSARLDVVGGQIRQQTQANSVTGNYTAFFTNSSSTVDSGTAIQHYNNSVIDAYFYMGGAAGNAGIVTIGTAASGAASERMRIDASGNVGIGTTSPTNRLTVSGNANVTGTLGVGSDANVSGNANVTGTLGVGSNANVTGNLEVTGTITSGGGLVMPTGAILEYGGLSAPTGWLLCNGDAVSRTTFAALFAVIGTTYGVGNGSSTFNVPNRINRFGVGAGGLYARGSTGGAATETTSTAGAHSHGGATAGHTLTEAQMPSHQHGGSTDVQGNHNHSYTGFLSNSGQSGGTLPVGQTSQDTSVNGAHSHSITTDSRGGNQAHSHTINSDGNHNHTVSTISPYVASNYIIKT